jgi:TetR/AcrR family fatty acid metabolism transcriptional regulator
MQQATRTQRALDRKRHILDAAVLAFAEKGFFNTRIADIARNAGVADGTIYLYFKSKDDILISVFEVRMEETLNGLAKALEHCGSTRKKLETFIELYLSLVEEDPALAEVVTVELRQSSKFIREYDNPQFKKLLRMVRELIEEGQSSGELRSDLQPHLVARALFGALDEVARWGVLSQREFNSNQVSAQLSDLLLGGLLRNP